MSFSRSTLADEIAKDINSYKSNKKLAKAIAAYLIEEGKTSELNSLERDIMQLRSVKNGIAELTAITSHPLEERQVKEIESLVKRLDPAYKTVIINQSIDESVIGGVRLELANQLLDLSVSSKLNKLRQLTS